MNKLRLILNKPGVSLLELVIASAIISTAAVPVFGLMSQALRGDSYASITSAMTFVGQFAMDSMLSADFTSLSNHESDIGPFAIAASINPYNPNALHSKIFYSAYVDSINPGVAADLSSATVDNNHAGYNSTVVSGNFFRIHVIVEYKENGWGSPTKRTLDLWTIVTPAGQGR